MSKGPLVFFNIGWMKKYRGLTPTDKITSGGSYVVRHGRGGEVVNFFPHNKGYYLGFVSPPREGSLVVVGTRTKLSGRERVSWPVEPRHLPHLPADGAFAAGADECAFGHRLSTRGENGCSWRFRRSATISCRL